MASITTWTKLETRQRTRDLDVSLAARVHDPLWLMARQWQMGEFRGHDSGRPVEVAIRASTGRIDRYQPGAPETQPTQRARPFDDSQQPLEAVVEGEPLTAETAPRLAVESGAHFLRLLKAANLDRYRQSFVSAFRVAAPADADLDVSGERFHNLVGKRMPDGFALHAALQADQGGSVPVSVSVDPTDVAAVVQVNQRWLGWMSAFVATTAKEGVWVPDRLEYSFAVAATVDESERVLTSSAYSSGSLDWHDFDLATGASLGSNTASELVVRTVLPAPVSYPGMPVPRWWEFEDAKVDLGAIDAGADDIARMLLVGFAVDYGNDWFVVPVDLPVGSLTRIQSLEVTDTFGVRTKIRSSTAVDGKGSAWRMYQLADPEGSSGEDAELLFLAPVLASSLDGPVRERVSIARDELANLAWAIEEIVESATGAPRRRDEEPQTPSRPTRPDGELSYQVATGIADHWHPLVVAADENGAVRLEQRQLVPAVGTILGAESPLFIFEEELPGEGLGIERAFQMTRWMKGRTAIWSSLQRTSGRGPTSSGLRFDEIRKSP